MSFDPKTLPSVERVQCCPVCTQVFSHYSTGDGVQPGTTPKHRVTWGYSMQCPGSGLALACREVEAR